MDLMPWYPPHMLRLPDIPRRSRVTSVPYDCPCFPRSLIMEKKRFNRDGQQFHQYQQNKQQTLVSNHWIQKENTIFANGNQCSCLGRLQK